MTLTVTHGAFHGMCSEFHDWRCALAKAAGYGIEKDGVREAIRLDWDAITDANIAGVWTAPPTDPLLVVFAHSDVGGSIMPVDAQRLGERLNELLIPSKWRAVTTKFIAGCRLASYRNEPMEFVWNPAATIARLFADILREKPTTDATFH